MYSANNQLKSTNSANPNITSISHTDININALNFNENSISQLPDQELHKLAKIYGANAHKWQKAFAALLPEIEKRRLYKNYKCHTIYEYAAKLCGMSRPTVDEILNVHSKLINKPALSNLMAEHGWSKLKVIANIATIETQEFWAEKVKQMSRNTLITFVQELRKQSDLENIATNTETNLETPKNVESVNFNKDSAEQYRALNPQQIDLFTNSDNIGEPRTGFCNPMAASQKEAMTIRLKPETETKLRIFKQKLEKQTQQPQDWDAIINSLLQSAEREIKLTKLRAKCSPKKTKKALKPAAFETKISIKSNKKEHTENLPTKCNQATPYQRSKTPRATFLLQLTKSSNKNIKVVARTQTVNSPQK